MENGEAELLRLIYTRIGTELEDAAVIALKFGGPKSEFDPDARERLVRSVAKITALTSAADALQE